MRVVLTGATGFLGSRTAEALAAAGHDLVLAVRRPSALGQLPPRAQAVRADLLEPETFGEALAGADALVHAAALVKRWVPDRSLFDRVNVAGLEALLDRARAAGIRRVVYVSSFLALGPTDGGVGDEDHLVDDAPRNDYERTKRAADRLARSRQAAGDPLVIVYPGVVYGPGELTDGNILAHVARDLLAGRLPGTIGPGDRRQCLAFVEDVARGVVLALERAAPGSRYLLGGENLTVREALEVMARAGGVGVPRRRIPYAVAALAGRLMRWRARWTGREPALTDGEVAIYRHEWAYSSARAQRDLGYTITPAEEGLDRLVRWLREMEASR